jgi:hypothetical protein
MIGVAYELLRFSGETERSVVLFVFTPFHLDSLCKLVASLIIATFVLRGVHHHGCSIVVIVLARYRQTFVMVGEYRIEFGVGNKKVRDPAGMATTQHRGSFVVS